MKKLDFRCEVNLYEKGVETLFKVTDLEAKAGRIPKGGKRGKVRRWSAASRGRLRQFLLTNSGRGRSEAVTLTVPGDVLPCSEWSYLAAGFWREAVRLKIPCVWRVELQQRKQPHLHVITWGDGSGAALVALWRSRVALLPAVTYYDKNRHKITCSRLGLAGAFDHCAEVSICESNSSGWWRYLCDHTSKKKQVQLGWKGRQWGVVYRKGFDKILPDSVSLSLPQWLGFMRVLRRLTRSRKWRGTSGRSVWFSNPSTVRRVVAWAVSEYPEFSP